MHPVARLVPEWSSDLGARGERPFRALEVFRWIHRKGELDPARMMSLPKSLRDGLFAGATSIGTVEHVHRSADDTRKAVVRLHDGAPIETVLIPRISGPGSAGKQPIDHPEASLRLDDPEASLRFDEDADVAAGDDLDDDDGEPSEGGKKAAIRVTQCVSTQVGCAMGCVFCASGIAGLKRHLGPEEIVGQVLLAKALLDPGEEIRNVVYMGMGEPLHNYEATKRSLELLTHPEGLSISTRRVTVSTSGLVPEIIKLGEDFKGQINLAISLHAADDERRTRLMPINKKYPLRELVAALKKYPLPPRRRITVEYTLVNGENDSDDDARRLVKLLRDVKVKINLIPMNPVAGSPLSAPQMQRVFAFQEQLAATGLSVFVRRRRGDDVAAACGQLALAGAKHTNRAIKKLGIVS